jgi:cytochrome P450
MVDAPCQRIAPAASQRRSAAEPRQAPPVVGARALLGSRSSVLRSPLDFLLEQRAVHGDVYALDLGGTRMILLNHPRHAQHVYRDHHARYAKSGPFWDLVRTLLGSGLPASEGEIWRRQRRMIQPQFHRERVPAMIDPLARAAGDRMASHPS